MCILGLSEPIDSVLTFPSGYDTLEYSWVKATAVSVRLLILFVMLQSTNKYMWPCAWARTSGFGIELLKTVQKQFLNCNQNTNRFGLELSFQGSARLTT